jgi:hypothetical protein
LLKTIKYPFEVNEMAWERTGRVFFLTTGEGKVLLYRFEDLLSGSKEMAQPMHTLNAVGASARHAPHPQPLPPSTNDRISADDASLLSPTCDASPRLVRSLRS